MIRKRLASFGLVLALLGCAAPHPGLPRGARLVGGGLQIEYRAPADGTAILFERTSGRIVATESLERGSDFDFDASRQSRAEILSSMFATNNGADSDQALSIPTNTYFELYFVRVKSAHD